MICFVATAFGTTASTTATITAKVMLMLRQLQSGTQLGMTGPLTAIELGRPGGRKGPLPDHYQNNISLLGQREILIYYVYTQFKARFFYGISNIAR